MSTWNGLGEDKMCHQPRASGWSTDSRVAHLEMYCTYPHGLTHRSNRAVKFRVGSGNPPEAKPKCTVNSELGVKHRDGEQALHQAHWSCHWSRKQENGKWLMYPESWESVSVSHLCFTSSSQEVPGKGFVRRVVRKSVSFHPASHREVGLIQEKGRGDTHEELTRRHRQGGG